MIYCVWYPSGGFGHFLNAVISLYGKNFVRPKKQIEFSANGNSHSIDLVVPPYYAGSWPGFTFQSNKNYTMLIDNGIDNIDESFRLVLPQAEVLKICYNDIAWPIVAKTMIEKAMNSILSDQLPTWHNDNWAVREKYFLFLRDHAFRYQWQPNTQYHVIQIDQLLNYTTCKNAIEACGIELDDFESTWEQWYQSNQVYIKPIITAQQVLDNITQKQPQDLSKITDIWTQAVIYFFIWKAFQIEVPHNDYANFFTNTTDIENLLEKACVF